MALYHFFSKEVLENIFDWEEFECDLKIFKSEYKKHNLIIGYKEGNSPIFSHLTYAEFLVAHWLHKQIVNKTPINVKDLVRKLYFTELTTIRKFFDNMITGNNPVFSHIINSYNMDKYSRLNLMDFEAMSIDILGRTVAHLFMSYGCTRYDIQTNQETRKALQNIDKNKDHGVVRKKKKFIEVTVPQPTSSFLINRVPIPEYLKLCISINTEQTDSFLGLNAIEFALMSGSLYELNEILINGKIKLPLNDQDKTYLLVYHCIKHQFNNLLNCVDLSGLKCQKVKYADNSSSLLHLAITSENYVAIKILLELANLEDWQTDEEGNTPLHLACKYKDICNIFQESLKHHDVSTEYLNKVNNKGRTLLHNLAHYGRKQWIESLIKIKGISIDVMCERGNTPFMTSIMSNKLNVAKILIARGSISNVHYKNNRGMTALHYAATKRYIKCCRFLLENGADVNCKNDFGRTPLIMAARKGHAGIVNLLLEHGAKIYVEDHAQQTALQYAMNKSNHNVVKLLKRFEIDDVIQIDTPHVLHLIFEQIFN